MRLIAVLAFLLCAIASLHATCAFTVSCDANNVPTSTYVIVNETGNWCINARSGCSYINVTVAGADLERIPDIIAVSPTIYDNGFSFSAIGFPLRSSTYYKTNGLNVNAEQAILRNCSSMTLTGNNASNSLCEAGSCTSVQILDSTGTSLTDYVGSITVQNSSSTTMTYIRQPVGVCYVQISLTGSDSSLMQDSALNLNCYDSLTFSDSLGVELKNVNISTGSLAASDPVFIRMNSLKLTNVKSPSVGITILNSTHAQIDDTTIGLFAASDTALDITNSNIAGIWIVNGSTPGGGIGASYFTNVTSLFISLVSSPTVMANVNLTGQLYVQDTNGVVANMANGSAVNSPSFINSKNIVFNPHCSSDNTQAYSLLCGSGALTLSGTNDSVFANFMYSAINLDHSNINTFNPVAFGTLVLSNSSLNTFTGAGANDTNFTPHASKVELYDSDSNTIEKMSFGTTCTSSYKTTSYIFGAGADSNTLQDNYFKENCAGGAEGQYTITIENGDLGNHVKNNIFEMVYQIISDNNPFSAVADYNELNANAYGLTINGSKNISGSVLAMTFPYTLYYGSEGSDYPYNTTTSSDDVYNMQDVRPLTSVQAPNTTGDLTLTIIQPTFMQQINGTTFTTYYSVVNGSNPHGCYIAVKPAPLEYYPYQYYVNCSSTNYSITVASLGEYNMVLGAYDDTGGKVATTTFDLVGNLTPPITCSGGQVLCNGVCADSCGGGGGGGGGNDTNPPSTCTAGCTQINGVCNCNTTCIPFLTCPIDVNCTTHPEMASCRAECITTANGTKCPWDDYCTLHPDDKTCVVVTNPILAGTMPWIANLDEQAKTIVLDSLVWMKSFWWLLVGALLAISSKDVMDKKETTRSVLAFAGAIVIALIFIG